MGPEPTDGDGRNFSDGVANFTASGLNAMSGNDVQTELGWATANAKSISYQKVGSNWFVVSYKDGDGNIVYQKSIIQYGVSYDLLITYPASKQATYGPMVTHIVDTFIPGHGES